MSDLEASPPLAWPDQAAFLSEARKLAAYTFERLGVTPRPALGMLAFPSERPDQGTNRPFLVHCDPIHWSPTLADWEAKVRIAEARIPPLGLQGSWTTARAIALSQVAAADLDTHDKEEGRRTFASSPASVGDYDVFFVLEFLDDCYRSTPFVEAQGDVGLVAVASEVVLQRLAEELRRGHLGVRSAAERRDVDQVLRDAGERLLDRTLWVAAESMHNEDIVRQLDAISGLRYEGTDCIGGLVFCATTQKAEVSMRFLYGVPLSSTVAARKILQMSTEDVWAVWVDDALQGIGPEELSSSRFWVRFRGHGHWVLGYSDRELAEVKFGIPLLPRPRLRPEAFEETFRRVFPDSGPDGCRAIWAFVAAAMAQGHGTMIVVVTDAPAEAERLERQSISVEPFAATPESLFPATEIDGAILLDANGSCHAIGVILDGIATQTGDPARGSRFNSAVRYVTRDDGGRLVVVVSEDGNVDLFPRLRPAFSRSQFAAARERLDQADRSGAVPPSEAFRKECRRLIKTHWSYLTPRERRAAAVVGNMLFFDPDDPGAAPPTFDKHPTDFFDDAEG